MNENIKVGSIDWWRERVQEGFNLAPTHEIKVPFHYVPSKIQYGFEALLNGFLYLQWMVFLDFFVVL